MMKKNSVYCYVSTILIVIFTLNFYSQSFGQMVIDDHCRVNLISQTTDWTSAFRCCSFGKLEGNIVGHYVPLGF